MAQGVYHQMPMLSLFSLGIPQSTVEEGRTPHNNSLGEGLTQPWLDQHSGKAISTADPTLASGSFNSLSQVLFTFQSLYLFTIGLVSILRLARDSPRFFKQQAQVVLLFE